MLRWIDTLKMRLQRRRRARKVENLQAWSRGLGVEATFEKIYADSKWGRGPDESRFFSGDGSRPENSGPYETFVSGFLHDHPEIGSLVDIGCGDFQVSGRILRRLSRSIDYTGCDVARSVVEHNKHTHSRQGVRFVHVDVVDADPPAGDAVTIRQVLQHLSNAQIARVLERLARLYKVAIITEALPVKFVAANIDIEHGSAVRIPLGSGVYIDEPPYGMKVAEAFDSPCSRKEFLRTSVVWFDRPVSDPAN